MSIDAVTTVSSGTDSPLAGAVDPGTARRISELGTNAQVQGKMQRLDGPPPQELGEVKPFQQAQPGEMIDLEAQEAGEQPAEMQKVEEAQEGPTPEQLAKEYQEFLDSPEIDTEKHGDKVIWYDSDGKGQMVPIRLKDVPNNILMYNDYQRKTTELAENNRRVERKENGMRQLATDMQAEDPAVQLRAIRQMTNPKAFEQMVIAYINDRARIEKYDPQTQQDILNAQKLADENFYLKRRQERAEALAKQQEQEQIQQQGAEAPDIKFVQDTIINALPATYQQLGISEAEYSSPAFQTILDQVFTAAATGERNPDGSWKSAPTIQRGRAPSKQHIMQLVAHAKQRVDSLLASPHAQRLAAPRKVATNAPLSGTGPAPGQGQRGNLSAPQAMRWSDMGKRK